MDLQKLLAPDAWAQHPTVKLVAGVHTLVMDVILQDPLALEFHLRNDLKNVYRASGKGLPPRYRLFWTASQQAHTVIFLYLNDDATLRKAGATSDPYEQCRAMIHRGEIGADFDQHMGMWRRAHGDTGRGARRPSGRPGTLHAGRRLQRRAWLRPPRPRAARSA